MSRDVPECETCPMEEPAPGFYVCKKCGYEKDYRTSFHIWFHAQQWSEVFGQEATAKLAWDEQQKRIDELTAELDRAYYEKRGLNLSD